MIRWIAFALVLAALAWLNAVVLAEAYGGGPPYYGRTTNMDKWSDPLPWLLPLDIAVVIIGILLERYFRRRPG